MAVINKREFHCRVKQLSRSRVGLQGRISGQAFASCLRIKSNNQFRTVVVLRNIKLYSGVFFKYQLSPVECNGLQMEINATYKRLTILIPCFLLETELLFYIH